MAVEDAYGAAERREGADGAPDEIAYRTEKITRSTCRAVAEYAFRTATKMGARVYGGPKWTVSRSTRACSRRRWTPPPRAIRTSSTSRC